MEATTMTLEAIQALPRGELEGGPSLMMVGSRATATSAGAKTSGVTVDLQTIVEATTRVVVEDPEVALIALEVVMLDTRTGEEEVTLPSQAATTMIIPAEAEILVVVVEAMGALEVIV